MCVSDENEEYVQYTLRPCATAKALGDTRSGSKRMNRLTSSFLLEVVKTTPSSSFLASDSFFCF